MSKSSNNRTVAKEENTGGKAMNGNKTVSRPTQPTLDFRSEMFLRGKSDKVEELISINVSFFKTGMETTYTVEVDGETHNLSASQFDAFLRKKVHEKSDEGAEKSAAGWASKLKKRTFLEVADPHDVARVRAIQAAPMPKLVSKMMGLTQKEWAEKKFGDEAVLIKYWSSITDQAKDEIDAYQFTLNEVSWSDALGCARTEYEHKVKLQAEKKAAKALGSAGTKDTLEDGEEELTKTLLNIAARKKEEAARAKQLPKKAPPPLPAKPEGGGGKPPSPADPPPKVKDAAEGKEAGGSTSSVAAGGD